MREQNAHDSGNSSDYRFTQIQQGFVKNRRPTADISDPFAKQRVVAETDC